MWPNLGIGSQGELSLSLAAALGAEVPTDSRAGKKEDYIALIDQFDVQELKQQLELHKAQLTTDDPNIGLGQLERKFREPVHAVIEEKKKSGAGVC